MKTIIIVMLLLTTLPAQAQWTGGAQPVQNERPGYWTASPSQDRSSANRRMPDCAERQRQATQNLIAAASQGDSRNYSARIAALAPLYRVSCN
jgi:hypothetical protein